MAETGDVGLLQRGAVLVGGRDRELIVATGADRVRFLHGIVTGDIAGTPVGRGCRSALLTLKAHVVADMFVFVRPDDVLIVTDAGQGEPTAAALARYAIMDDVAFAWRADFAKGCFLGQEPIVRLRDRGHINWRLVQLEVPGAADPAPGDALESDAKPKAGRITSVARGLALGMLHVSLPIGASVRIKHGD